jgi:hypothetical protein
MQENNNSEATYVTYNIIRTQNLSSLADQIYKNRGSSEVYISPYVEEINIYHYRDHMVNVVVETIASYTENHTKYIGLNTKCSASDCYSRRLTAYS